MLLAGTAAGHDPITTKLTFSKEISRILYSRCVSCHKDYLQYETARPWAKAMRDEVLSRRMPPWGAVKGVGDFKDDQSLSQVEIDLITGWVEGGAPEGDPQFLPQPPAAASRPEQIGGEVRAPLTLAKPLLVLGVKPRGNCEVTAYLPDGSVRHLIWMRWYDARFPRSYWFRDPLQFPVGTRIAVTGTVKDAVLITPLR